MVAGWVLPSWRYKSRGWAEGGCWDQNCPSRRNSLEASRWEPCALRGHLSETLVISWKWDFIGPVQFRVKCGLGEKSRSADSGRVRASVGQGGFLVRAALGILAPWVFISSWLPRISQEQESWTINSCSSKVGHTGGWESISLGKQNPHGKGKTEEKEGKASWKRKLPLTQLLLLLGTIPLLSCASVSPSVNQWLNKWFPGSLPSGKPQGSLRVVSSSQSQGLRNHPEGYWLCGGVPFSSGDRATEFISPQCLPVRTLLHVGLFTSATVLVTPVYQNSG